MKIDTVKVGYLQENCYILDIDNNVLVIDPGDEGDKIINKIGNRKVLGILIIEGFSSFNTCIRFLNLS